MKMNFVFSVVFVCLFLTFSGCNQNKGLVYKREIKKLKTDGRWIVNADDGQKRLLRGVNISGMEYDSLGNKVNLKNLTVLLDQWNINIARLPVNQDWWLKSVEYQGLVDERINFLKSKGVYTILDLQWIDAVKKIDPLPDSLSIVFWTGVAEKYKNESAILFDIYNEPRNCTHQEWDAKAKELIIAIRAIKEDAVILVNGIDWGYDIGGFIQNPLPFENIIYGTHIYPQKPGSGYKNKPEYMKYWKGILEKNLPLFVGEFGPEELNYDHKEQLDSYLDPLFLEFDKNQLGYTAWSWYNKPFLTKNGNGNPDSLTLFGKRVFENLKNTK